jgi:hypothetical protein
LVEISSSASATKTSLDGAQKTINKLNAKTTSMSAQLATDGAAIHSAALTMSAIRKLPADAQQPTLWLMAKIYWLNLVFIAIAVLFSLLAFWLTLRKRGE